ncbi:MAG: helix-turn-helix domain-containing protein [Oscillospiraceae bacterium]
MLEPDVYMDKTDIDTEVCGLDILYVGNHTKMYQVNTHTHEYCELIYCTGGSGGFQTQTRQVSYHAGQLVIVPAGLAHQNSSEEGFSNLYIAVANLAFPVTEMCLVQDSESRDLESTLKQLHHYFSLYHGSQNIVVQALSHLAETYLRMFRNITHCSPEVSAIENRLIENFGNSHFSAKNAMVDIPLNEEYARKLFAREKGISPARFLLRLRIEHACKMLEARHQFGLSIAQVADACGFSDPLYFSRVFKSETGRAPSQYGANFAGIPLC